MKKYLIVGLMLSGCAGSQVKKAQDQMVADLNGIIQMQDCQLECEALKAYVAKQLGQIPAPVTPSAP